METYDILEELLPLVTCLNGPPGADLFSDEPVSWPCDGDHFAKSCAIAFLKEPAFALSCLKELVGFLQGVLVCRDTDAFGAQSARREGH